MHVCAHLYTHGYAHVDTHVYVHVYTHAYTRACTRVYTNVCAYVYTHVHTQLERLSYIEDVICGAVICAITIIGISASPTACPLRGYGRAGTQNDRLSEAVILSTGTLVPV